MPFSTLLLPLDRKLPCKGRLGTLCEARKRFHSVEPGSSEGTCLHIPWDCFYLYFYRRLPPLKASWDSKRKKKNPPVNVKSSEKSPHESSCAVRPRNGNLEKSRQFLDAWLHASGLCFPRWALLKGKGRRSAKSLARHQHAERIKASMAESAFLGERRAHAESPYLHYTGLFNPD